MQPTKLLRQAGGVMPKTESEEEGQRKNEASKSRKEAGAPRRAGLFLRKTLRALAYGCRPLAGSLFAVFKAFW